jgi:serine protease Do
MRLKCSRFVPILFVTFWWGTAEAGILKSLDQELTALVAKTDPYLVTVKGEDRWHNLIATGIVCDSAGYLLTSSQVYEAAKFSVIFKNGRTIEATKVGVDYRSGLAILKITNGKYAVPEWGRTDKLGKGAWITVVGNSYGVPATVNFGYFSGLTNDGLLGLAVNASPGSSGGAVLNIDGQVVGVLVAREAGTLGSVDSAALARAADAPYSMQLLNGLGNPGGLCYAVPIDVAMNISTQIVKFGKVHRGFIGVRSRDLEPCDATAAGLHGGAIITGVEDGSPAAAAGLQKGDIVTAADSAEVDGRASLLTRLRCHEPGDTLRLKLLRNKEKIAMKVTLGEAREDSQLDNSAISQVHQADNLLNDQRSIDAAGIRSELYRLKAEVVRLQMRLDDLERKSNHVTD